MDGDRMFMALLIMAMALAAAVVGFNVFTSPGFGEPVYTPSVSESAPVVSASSLSASEQESGVSFPLNINTATLEEFQLIPDIGPVTAQKIVDFRTNVGTILDIGELEAVEGIGIKTVERLKEYCVAE